MKEGRPVKFLTVNDLVKSIETKRQKEKALKREIRELRLVIKGLERMKKDMEDTPEGCPLP